MCGLERCFTPQEYWLFDFRLTSYSLQLSTLAASMVDDLHLKTGRCDDVKIDLMICMLSNLYQASLQWKCLAISRTPDWYAKIPVDEKLQIHSSKFVTAALDALEQAGLIVQYLGQHYDNHGELTKIHPTVILTHQLSFLTNADLEYLLQDAEIILRDSNGFSIPFAETPDTTAMRNDIIMYNELLEKSVIALFGLSSDDRINHSEYLIRNTYYNFDNEDIVVLRPMRIRRIFNIDFQHGGRFYGGIENMPSELRTKIQINGEPTVELDYAAYQLRMLYHMENIDYRSDAYAAVDGYTPDMRKVYKRIALVALNAENEAACLKGIRNELRGSALLVKIGGTTDAVIRPMLQKWVNAHPQLQQYMYSGVGLSLQAIESDITNNVLKHFQKRGVLVLSVHDSFLIESSREKVLKKVMRSMYRARFGFNPVIK